MGGGYCICNCTSDAFVNSLGLLTILLRWRILQFKVFYCYFEKEEDNGSFAVNHFAWDCCNTDKRIKLNFRLAEIFRLLVCSRLKRNSVLSVKKQWSTITNSLTSSVFIIKPWGAWHFFIIMISLFMEKDNSNHIFCSWLSYIKFFPISKLPFLNSIRSCLLSFYINLWNIKE